MDFDKEWWERFRQDEVEEILRLTRLKNQDYTGGNAQDNPFENFDGSIRNRPAALNWSRAIKLMAAFGLRPIELKYLEKRVDRKTKKKYLWCQVIIISDYFGAI